jgi:hypothetical protein
VVITIDDATIKLTATPGTVTVPAECYERGQDDAGWCEAPAN